MKKLILAVLFSLFSVTSFAQNISGVLAASAARTATFTSTDQTNVQWRGVHVIVDITAFTSGTWTVTIQGKDPVSEKYYTLLTGAALAGTGTTVYKVYPGIVAVANASVPDFLPKTWRVVVTGAATPVATFSVGFNLEL